VQDFFHQQYIKYAFQPPQKQNQKTCFWVATKDTSLVEQMRPSFHEVSLVDVVESILGYAGML